MSSALTKATTKTKRNDDKTVEGFVIWEMSNKTITILITVVEMNVDCKDVYAKANCAEINVWGGEGGRRGSRATSLCFWEVFPQL